jgi:hypothetical protein
MRSSDSRSSASSSARVPKNPAPLVARQTLRLRPVSRSTSSSANFSDHEHLLQRAPLDGADMRLVQPLQLTVMSPVLSPLSSLSDHCLPAVCRRRSVTTRAFPLHRRCYALGTRLYSGTAPVNLAFISAFSRRLASIHWSALVGGWVRKSLFQIPGLCTAW